MNKPVYIFDADGVLNNISDYKVDNRVIQQIAALLKSGHYIAINTGRGYPWVRKNVIEEIRAHVNDDTLSCIFISAEMGGVTVEFAKGVEQDGRTAFSLLPEQIKQVREVFDQNAGDKNLAWYDGKASMATIYKPSTADPSMFMQAAQKIASELQGIFANGHVKISVNPDALDVTTPEAGKWAGAQLVHDWLQRTPAAHADHVICIGDNASDYEMARFFGQQGHTVDFIFTGESLGAVEHDPHATITRTSRPYNNGTYDFLSTALADGGQQCI